MNTSSVTRTGVLAATGSKGEAEGGDSVSLGFYLITAISATAV